MKIAFVATVLALALAPAAGAKPAPLVPLEQQAQMKQVLSSFGFNDLAYVPTKAPADYTYESNVVNSTQNLITLQDGSAVTYFTAQFFTGKLSNCGKGSQVKLTVAGSTVYSKGTNVWRCVSGTGGKVVKINGSGLGLSREDLGTMIASAKLA
jgi:hypothetical protein